MNIILMGHQGSGKGTQAKNIASELGYLRVEAGRILRNAAKTDKKIDELVNKKGKLAPAKVVFEKVRDFILENKNEIDGVVLDGFPRTKSQWDYMEDWLEQKNAKIDYVFFLVISEEETIKRLSARRICEDCGEVYNLNTNPPPKGGCKCGGKLIHREDDKPDAIKSRLEWSVRESKPLIKRFKKLGIFKELDGERSIDDIYKDILSILKKNDKK